MKTHKLVTILVALLLVAVPAMAVFTGMGLDATLSNLRRELNYDYLHISSTREQMAARYDVQHQKMVDIVKKCNDLSLMLYSQKQDYTFDISYALEKVCEEFNDFNKNRTPYDRIVSSIDVEINRYARLIESLRRLPPELREVEVVPDSLAYHNDSLDVHLMQKGKGDPGLEGGVYPERIRPGRSRFLPALCLRTAQAVCRKTGAGDGRQHALPGSRTAHAGIV